MLLLERAHLQHGQEMEKGTWLDTTSALFAPLTNVTHFGLFWRGEVSVITRYRLSAIGISVVTNLSPVHNM